MRVNYVNCPERARRLYRDMQHLLPAVSAKCSRSSRIINQLQGIDR